MTDEQRRIWMDGWENGLDHGHSRGAAAERARIRRILDRCGELFELSIHQLALLNDLRRRISTRKRGGSR